MTDILRSLPDNHEWLGDGDVPSHINVEKADRYGTTVYRPDCPLSRLLVRMKKHNAKELTSEMLYEIRSAGLRIYNQYGEEVS
jgi:hypothetical protein